MNDLDEAELTQRLLNEFNYPEKGAQLIIKKLSNCQPEIKAAFNRWWQTGQLTSFAIENYTVQRLQKEHAMNPIAAFLTLDWLLREPETALTSLRKGHDKIVKK